MVGDKSMRNTIVAVWVCLPFLFSATCISAAPMADFCLSEVPASDTEVKPETGFERPTRPRFSRLDFEAGGKKYYLLAYARQLAMYQADGTQMQAYELEQNVDEADAGDMVLHEGGWLWIDTKPMGYSAWLDTVGATPSLSQPKPITTLKDSDQCDRDDEWWYGWSAGRAGSDEFNCEPASAYYSPMLKRVFLKGYERYWGYFYRGPIYQEIQGDHIREIPAEPVGEIPKFGIYLFRGGSGELLFDDGNGLKEFGKNRDPKTGRNDLGGGDLVGVGFITSKPAGRKFLTTFHQPDRKPLLAELLPGPRVVPILLGGGGGIDFISGIYDFYPQDVAFLIHRGGIEVLRNRTLKNVVSVTRSTSKIDEVFRGSNGSIRFSVREKFDKERRRYVLRPSAGGKGCDIPLDPERPAQLDYTGQVSKPGLKQQ